MQTAPVAIGGIGGSGTRVIAGILQDLGYFMGHDLNDALDNLLFTLLFKRQSLWPLESHQAEIDHLVSTFVRLTTGGEGLSDSEMEMVQACVAEATDEHPLSWRAQRLEKILQVQRTSLAGGAKWGWKEPNAHIVLHCLNRKIPGIKYVHVMRHGVDMALSSNQNQLKLWGRNFLGREVQIGPGDSLRYWCAVHRRLQGFQEVMGARFLLLNFDNFCRNPESGLRNLASFLGADLGVIRDLALNKIQAPDTLGRYQSADMSMFEDQDLEYVQKMGFAI